MSIDRSWPARVPGGRRPRRRRRRPGPAASGVAAAPPWSRGPSSRSSAASGSVPTAVAQLFAGGSAPASAVPADAIGYVSLDLDPSASQKIEAIKILRKFPALKKRCKISSRDDMRRAVFDQIVKSGRLPGARLRPRT